MFKNFHTSLEELEESCCRSDVFRQQDWSDCESTESSPEEDKVRRIFSTCDTDGDGFITSQDIEVVCKQLNLEFSVNEIMNQLGTDEAGKISFDDFLKRRLELLQELRSQTNSVRSSDDEYVWSFNDPHYWRTETPSLVDGEEGQQQISSAFTKVDCSRIHSDQVDSDQPDQRLLLSSSGGAQWLPGSGTASRGSDSASQSAEASSSAKRESSSCDVDSGAHDLDMDQVSLRKLLETSGVTIPEEKNDVVEIANKVHQSVLHSIKHELNEVNTRLKLVLRERDLLEKQITVTKRDHARIVKDIERRRHRDNLRYEDRITELSSVIAELSEKLEHHSYNVFKEEEEYTASGSEGFSLPETELSKLYSDGSILVKDSTESKLIRSPNCLKLVTSGDVSTANSLMRSSSSLEAMHSCLVSEVDSSFQKCLEIIGSNLDKTQIAEFVKLEIEKLKFKLLHTQTQVDLTRFHLEESKESAERLMVLLGKYESNNTALQLALTYSDSVLDSWRVSSDLKDSEMGLLLASCRAAGLGKIHFYELSEFLNSTFLDTSRFTNTVHITDEEDKEEVLNILRVAKERRARAESKALQFVNCLLGDGSKETLAGSSTTDTTSATPASTSQPEVRRQFSKKDEEFIVEHRSKIEADILAIKSSLVDIEPLHTDQDQDTPGMNTTTVHHGRKHKQESAHQRTNRNKSLSKVDLENIVLAQELMALKEERADLRSQIFILQKELRASNLQLGTDKVVEERFGAELERLRKQRRCQQCHQGSSCTKSAPSSSSDGHQEESQKKDDQVHELLMSLSQITKNYEQRVEEYKGALKAAKSTNSTLKSKLDRLRRKQEERLRQAEIQLKKTTEDEQREANLDQNVIKRTSKETMI